MVYDAPPPYRLIRIRDRPRRFRPRGLELAQMREVHRVDKCLNLEVDLPATH